MKSRKLNYITRPSKHIERKIFVDVLRCLSKIGYNIPKYHYVGFGSYYYADFILFNRHLSITDMTCLENDKDIKKRMEFNKPFKFIDLKIEDCGKFITKIDKSKRYIVWLDFEKKLNKTILVNIKSLIHSLKDGSLFIITVNADSKEMSGLEFANEAISSEFNKKQIDLLYQKSSEELNPFCGEIKRNDVSPKNLPSLYSKTIKNAIINALIARSGESSFYQLFNYIYQDGARMLTFGGIIDSNNKETIINESLSGIKKYINYDEIPTKIELPSLTLKEKIYLDQNIEKNDKIKGGLSGLPFELSSEELLNYLKFSKHYPTFYETIIN